MPTDIGGGIGSPADEGTAKPKGSGLAAWANALAGSLGISPKEATAQIKAYIAKNGGSAERAARALVGGAQVSGGQEGSTEGSGGSTGGSTGSSGAPAGPSPQQLRNAQASYLAILSGWQIPLTPGIHQLVAQAAQKGVSTTAFIQGFRQTKAYAQRFAGIMKPNGTMRMTEAQYIAGYNSAKDAARAVGRNLTPQAYGMAIKNGNSPAEIGAKIQAVDVLKSKPQIFQEFSDYLQATGVNKKPLGREDVLSFVMGQGPKAWEQAWQTANDAATLARYDLDVGKPKTGSDISYKELAKLQKQQPPGEEIDTAALEESLAAMPASQRYRMGITQKDRAELAFKTKNAPAIAARVKLTLATARERFNEGGQASAPHLSPGGGVQGTAPAAATE